MARPNVFHEGNSNASTAVACMKRLAEFANLARSAVSQHLGTVEVAENNNDETSLSHA